jgi:hypothetical protein
VLNRSFHFGAGILLATLWWGGMPPQSVTAQTLSGTDALKSEVYFGLRATDGKIVDEQAWGRFVTDVVVPRFPAGLTILEAMGRSGSNPENLNPTRILVVVHSADAEAQNRIREVKAEYKKRFGGVGLFHTDQAVRVHAGD